MDFLGTTTPANLLASVTNGVQSTGTDFWPLIVLVGIPLAFILGKYVVDFIQGTVRSRMSDPGSPSGYYESTDGGPALWAEDQDLARARYEMEHEGFTILK